VRGQLASDSSRLCGHWRTGGGGTLNIFWVDFKEAQSSWNICLCRQNKHQFAHLDCARGIQIFKFMILKFLTNTVTRSTCQLELPALWIWRLAHRNSRGAGKRKTRSIGVTVWSGLVGREIFYYYLDADSALMGLLLLNLFWIMAFQGIDRWDKVMKWSLVFSVVVSCPPKNFSTLVRHMQGKLLKEGFISFHSLRNDLDVPTGWSNQSVSFILMHRLGCSSPQPG
jgi:hypothetical protein